MRTAIGLAIVAAVLVGLPLLAWTVGRRLPLPRPANIREDPSMWLVRTLGMTGVDHAAVVEAVAYGRQVEPRLRAAALAYGVRLEQEIRRQTRWTTRRRLIALWPVLSCAAIANRIVGHFTGLSAWWIFFYVVVYPLLIHQAGSRRLQRVQRAIDLNRDTTP